MHLPFSLAFFFVSGVSGLCYDLIKGRSCSSNRDTVKYARLTNLSTTPQECKSLCESHQRLLVSEGITAAEGCCGMASGRGCTWRSPATLSCTFYPDLDIYATECLLGTSLAPTTPTNRPTAPTLRPTKIITDAPTGIVGIGGPPSNTPTGKVTSPTLPFAIQPPTKSFRREFSCLRNYSYVAKLEDQSSRLGTSSSCAGRWHCAHAKPIEQF